MGEAAFLKEFSVFYETQQQQEERLRLQEVFRLWSQCRGCDVCVFHIVSVSFVEQCTMVSHPRLES